MSGYTYDNSLGKSSEMLSGIWTMKVCTGDNQTCVEKTFTGTTNYVAPAASTPATNATASAPAASIPVAPIPPAPSGVKQLTIDNLRIYEDTNFSSRVMYHVAGDAPKYEQLKITFTKPDGSAGIYPTSYSAGGDERYRLDGQVASKSDMGSGLWTIKICVFDLDMCVEKTFAGIIDYVAPTAILSDDVFIDDTFEDNLAPTFTTNALEFKTTNPNGMRIDYPLPLVSDNAVISAIPVCAPTSGSIFPVGTTNVICIVTDEAGNTGTDSFIVTVVNTQATGDNFPPTFTTPLTQTTLGDHTNENTKNTNIHNTTNTDNISDHTIDNTNHTKNHNTANANNIGDHTNDNANNTNIHSTTNAAN